MAQSTDADTRSVLSQLHFYADDGNVCQDVRDEKILQDIRRG